MNPPHQHPIHRLDETRFPAIERYNLSMPDAASVPLELRGVPPPPHTSFLLAHGPPLLWIGIVFRAEHRCLCCFALLLFHEGVLLHLHHVRTEVLRERPIAWWVPERGLRVPKFISASFEFLPGSDYAGERLSEDSDPTRA